MATTEADAASYKVTGRDEDDDKRSTREEEQARTRCRSGTTGRGNTRSTKRTKSRRQVDRGVREDKKKAGATSGLSKDNTVNRHTQRLP